MINSKDDQTTQLNNLFVVKVWSGLTSRCYTMVEAVRLAQRYNRKLVILWPIDKDCACKYHDIFDMAQFNDCSPAIINLAYGAKPSKEEVLDRIKSKKFLRAISLVMKWGIWKLRYPFINRKEKKYLDDCKNYTYFLDPMTGEKFNQSLLEAKENVFVSAYCGITGETIDDLSKIKFKSEFYNKADKIINKQQNYIGIHIRRTDHDNAIQYSKDVFFENRIKKLLSENKNQLFFLATDDAIVKAKFVNEFNSNIITNDSAVLNRTSREGIEAAIVDILCLAGAKEIWASCGSVFSGFSAKLRGIPRTEVGTSPEEMESLAREGNFVISRENHCFCKCPAGKSIESRDNKQSGEIEIFQSKQCSTCAIDGCKLKHINSIKLEHGAFIKKALNAVEN